MVDTSYNFSIKRVFETETEGEFVISPLAKGFGNTLANPVRRILLSSLEGGAITSIRLAGVSHEYSVVPGVQDDLLKLSIKLKEVAIKCFVDEPVVTKLKVKAAKGEVREVTAADIEKDSRFEIVNPNYVLTSISDGNELEAEIIIEKGIGFKVADSSKRSEIGAIPLDGSFSPVENVEMKITNVRVGHRTDFEQVSLKITTNGVLSPSEALTSALQINKNIADKLAELSEGSMDGGAQEEVAANEAKSEVEDAIMIKNLKLSTRLRNSLINSAISDLRVLTGKSRDELLEIKGMGQKSVDELIAVMQEHQLNVTL